MAAASGELPAHATEPSATATRSTAGFIGVLDVTRMRRCSLRSAGGSFFAIALKSGSPGNDKPSMATRHAPPPPPPPVGSSNAASLEEIAIGQRLLIFSILVNVAAVVLRGATGGDWLVFAPVALAGAAMAIVGLLRLGSGLGYASATIGLMIALTFVPVANIVMLGMVSQKATKRLQEAGYEVGLLGARRRGA